MNLISVWVTFIDEGFNSNQISGIKTVCLHEKTGKNLRTTFTSQTHIAKWNEVYNFLRLKKILLTFDKISRKKDNDPYR